tara:strand:+ start:11322 stop:11768 length:447 start_codon:yes stop_codon:yes gene_type:complete
MAVDFFYTLNERDISDFREEGVQRLQSIKDKGYDSNLSSKEMYDVLYERCGRILCIVTDGDKPVGMLVLIEIEDVFRGERTLFIEMCHLDNIPGLFDEVHSEVEKLVAMDRYDSVRFHVQRKGWAQKIAKSDSGYSIASHVVEKTYGR